MARARSVRVLVLDNQPHCEDPVTHFLRQAGNEVLSMFGGSFAIGEARDFAPELVVIHCGTAEFDGLSVVKRFRRRRSFGSIPLVALTSDGAAEAAFFRPSLQWRYQFSLADKLPSCTNGSHFLRSSLPDNVDRILVDASR